MADYHPPAPRIQEQDLHGKLAIVTGATKGIGRAIALDLATRGCSIIGTYSSAQSAHLFDVLAHTVHDLYRAGDAKAEPSQHAPTTTSPVMQGVVADIKDLESVQSIITQVTPPTPAKIDILILSAAHNTRPKLGSATASDISHTLTANIHWPICLMEALVSKSLFNPNARIVLLSSDRVRDPAPGSALFNASKSALESLARSWAVELPLTFPGTTVNAVSVGLTDTPGVRSFPAAMVEAMKAQRVPKVKVVSGGRMGFAEDVADVVGWLCSEKARWVSGSVVAANGGAEWVGGSS